MLLLVISGSLFLSAFSMIGMRFSSMTEGLDMRPSPNAGRDKRKSARFLSEGPVEIEMEPGHFVGKTTALLNLSSQGACVVSNRTFRLGQQIVARLHPTHRSPLRVTGWVVWFKPRSNFMVYGLKFKSIVLEVGDYAA
jgi:hypothetical protein